MAEHEVSGELDNLYHDIRQTLRVSGVNLNFRTWAGYERFFPVMWSAIRENAETSSFEQFANELRQQGVGAAARRGPIRVVPGVRLGESQAHQVRAALNLYHYINPKLLVLTSAVRLALDGERLEGHPLGTADSARIERGIPAGMYPMEMVEERSGDPRVRRTFSDIRKTLGLHSTNSDFRTLALWPEYLISAWAKLKPLVKSKPWVQDTDALRDASRGLARELAHPVRLSPKRIRSLGEPADSIRETAAAFERVLPSLILAIATLQLDWIGSTEASKSPFPARIARERSAA